MLSSAITVLEIRVAFMAGSAVSYVTDAPLPVGSTSPCLDRPEMSARLQSVNVPATRAAGCLARFLRPNFDPQWPWRAPVAGLDAVSADTDGDAAAEVTRQLERGLRSVVRLWGVCWTLRRAGYGLHWPVLLLVNCGFCCGV